MPKALPSADAKALLLLLESGRGSGSAAVCVSDAEAVEALLVRCARDNAPGGRNFEAARLLLEKYRWLAFAAAGEDLQRGAKAGRLHDPFDASSGFAAAGRGAEASAKGSAKDPAGSSAKDAAQNTGKQGAQTSGDGLSQAPLSLEKQLLFRVDAGIAAMMDSEDPVIADEGELLYARFVKPEYEDRDTSFYMALFSSSRATFFRMQSSAVSHLAVFLFGAFAAAGTE